MPIQYLVVAGAEGNMPAGLSSAVSAITDAMGTIATTVAANPLMLIGIAGGMLALGAGLFMKLTGQRRGRRR